jgi:hypothetical protein
MPKGRRTIRKSTLSSSQNNPMEPALQSRERHVGVWDEVCPPPPKNTDEDWRNRTRPNQKSSRGTLQMQRLAAQSFGAAVAAHSRPLQA